MNLVHAGAAAVDISPIDSQYLYGYPNVRRMSIGIHDPLLASALAIRNGPMWVMFIGTDSVVAVGHVVENARRRICAQTGVPMNHIMISSSHTHSAPLVQKLAGSFGDPMIPDPDPAYRKQFEEGIVAAGLAAFANAQPAVVGLGVADGSGVGTNRHDPHGPSLPAVPVLSVRHAENDQPIAVMLVCNVHPTVLHEDSLYVSADFPGYARQYLQRRAVGGGCPIIYHMGAAGNQSPRHVIEANTFKEANRVGDRLGRSVEETLSRIEHRDQVKLVVGQRDVNLPIRIYPSVETAKNLHLAAVQRLESLRRRQAPRGKVRTAECDTFGSAQTLLLARLSATGGLKQALSECRPAEIQCIGIGPWTFIGWPGEIFVEFAHKVMEDRDNTFVITMANHPLHGYIATQYAVDHKLYEAGITLLKCPEAGDLLVRQTIRLMHDLFT